MDQTRTIPEEQIKRRAFELWQQHGGRDGHESEFWAQAELELKNDKQTQTTSSPPFYARSGSGSNCRY